METVATEDETSYLIGKRKRQQQQQQPEPSEIKPKKKRGRKPLPKKEAKPEYDATHFLKHAKDNLIPKIMETQANFKANCIDERGYIKRLKPIMSKEEDGYANFKETAIDHLMKYGIVAIDCSSLVFYDLNQPQVDKFIHKTIDRLKEQGISPNAQVIAKAKAENRWPQGLTGGCLNGVLTSSLADDPDYQTTYYYDDLSQSKEAWNIRTILCRVIKLISPLPDLLANDMMVSMENILCTFNQNIPYEKKNRLLGEKLKNPLHYSPLVLTDPKASLRCVYNAPPEWHFVNNFWKPTHFYNIRGLFLMNEGNSMNLVVGYHLASEEYKADMINSGYLKKRTAIRATANPAYDLEKYLINIKCKPRTLILYTQDMPHKITSCDTTMKDMNMDWINVGLFLHMIPSVAFTHMDLVIRKTAVLNSIIYNNFASMGYCFECKKRGPSLCRFSYRHENSNMLWYPFHPETRSIIGYK
jgi:hypothetical protein